MVYLKIIAGLVLLICVVFFLLGLVSQKGKAKGLKDGKLAPCPSSPNCVSSEGDTQPEKKVDPLTGSMEDAKRAILSLGGVITSESEAYISATFMSSVFKFVDDVEIRPGEKGEVHIRSASRVGYSDRGVNKRRVAAIRAEMAK